MLFPSPASWCWDAFCHWPCWLVFSVFEVDFDAFTLVPAFSGQSWVQMFTNPVFSFLIGKAVVSGAGTALLAALIGYPIAVSMTRLPVLWKGVGSIVLLTPLYTGEIVRIYAWRVVLGSEGLVNAVLKWLGAISEPLKFLLFSPFTTHLVLLYNNLPFMVLAIWISAELIDKRLIEAARDLGARPIDAFFKVVLPLTTPGLAVGTFTVFALAAGDMMTPSLLGGTSGRDSDGHDRQPVRDGVRLAPGVRTLAQPPCRPVRLRHRIRDNPSSVRWRTGSLSAGDAMSRLVILTLGLAVCFFYLPIVVLGIFSFNAASTMAFPLSGFTLSWYSDLFGNQAFLGGFVTSFLIAQPVGVLGALIGLMAALALTSPRMKFRAAFAILVLVPFLVPKTVLSIAQAMLMSWVGLGRGATALILAQTLVAIPFTTTITCRRDDPPRPTA